MHFLQKLLKCVFLCFHILEMKKTQNDKKNAKTDKFFFKYECKACNYTSSNKYDFKRHLSTKKHKKREIARNNVSNEIKKTQKTQKIAINYCICGRRFQTRSGEWKHKKKCTFWDMHTKKNVSKTVSNNLQIVSKPDNLGNTKKRNFIVTEKKTQKNAKIAENNNYENIEEKLNSLRLQKAELEVKKLEKEIENLNDPNRSTTLTSELVETIGKIAGNTNCNNTNNISINMYLNENCKNAMNLEDFVKKITISLQDLNYSKNNGYVGGITNILLKQLKDLSPDERPIHCSDKKRLKFYVKDDNKWEPDNQHEKINKTIKNITVEQVKTLSKWEQKNPDFQNDEKLLSEWQDTLKNITGGISNNELLKNEKKIKQEIGKFVDLNKELKQ